MKARDYGAMSDQKLLMLSAENDEKAFEALLSRYEKLAYNLAFYKVRNEEDAKDIVWEAFLKLWNSASLYRGDGNVSSYIYAIVKNCTADLLRRRKEVLSLTVTDSDGEETELPITDSDDTPEEVLIREEKIQAVRDAINSLPPKYREVVIMYDIEGKSYQRIADTLSIDIGTVKSRLNRARKKLGNILGNGNNDG